MDLHFQSRRKPRTAEKLNEMARRLNIQGFGVTASPLGTTLANRRVYYAATGFPWGDEFTFGLERTAANKIKVLNCKARRYGDPQGTSIYYVCADKEITFSGDGDGQKICWKWNPTDGLRIFDNAQTNDPMDDGTDICGVVAIFDVTNSRAELATGGVIQCGQVIVLPVFTVAGA